jgi:hypothetical protein
MSKTTDADRVHHLMSIASAARRIGISPRLLKEAVHRGQMGEVRLLQVGARQYVHAGLLLDHLEATRAPRGGA